MKQKLIIATRGSKLALRQSEIVKQLLVAQFPGLEVEFLIVTTQGDTDQKTPLIGFGNSGVFVKGLEEKLLSGEADLAVHSLKDIPSELHPDLLLATFP
jgi:hydroxymethylbilane synthase